ncbi:MAG: SDR family NAD(P)-dependent oxidoreductase [Bacteroidota bacterium]
MRKILITGGSQGIGLELAHAFAKIGDDLFLIAKEDGLLPEIIERLKKEYPKVFIQGLEINLAKTESALMVYQETLKANFLPDILINNAGFGTYGYVWETNQAKEFEMLQLNVLNLYQMTRYFLADMVKRNGGWIINISSISAFQPNPRLSTYGASKSFVLQFTRSLDFELREAGLNVRTMAVCPTPVVNTGFMQFAGMEKSRTFKNWMVVTPKIVVRDIFKGMKKGKNLVIPGKGLSFLLEIIKRLPEAFVIWMSAYYLRENRN